MKLLLHYNLFPLLSGMRTTVNSSSTWPWHSRKVPMTTPSCTRQLASRLHTWAHTIHQLYLTSGDLATHFLHNLHSVMSHYIPRIQFYDNGGSLHTLEQEKKLAGERWLGVVVVGVMVIFILPAPAPSSENNISQRDTKRHLPHKTGGANFFLPLDSWGYEDNEEEVPNHPPPNSLDMLLNTACLMWVMSPSMLT